ncbi:MAG: hypothetical protein PHZ00_00965 [Candidatus Peribacteraceae bacterium]|nr:hypothetical protein [Candidatus Peribacteraceae bacterium]
MSNVSSPEGGERRIQQEQLRIDKLDQTVDRKVDLGKEQEARLTETYIKRVNDVQGRIRSVQRLIDIRKDSKSDGWQKLEETCNEVSRGLLESLSRVDHANAVSDVAAFDARIDGFLQRFTGTETVTAGGENAAESNETVLRKVRANIALVRVLPEAIRETLFAEQPSSPDQPTPAAFDEDAVNDLIENGKSLDGSPYAYLLGDCTVPIRDMQERLHDRLSIKEADIGDLQERERKEMDHLIDLTKNGQYNLLDLLTDKIAIEDEAVRISVRNIKDSRAKVLAMQQTRQPLDLVAAQLDTALALHASAEAAAAGDTELSARHLLKLREVHGEQLKDMLSASTTTKDVWSQIETATATLRDQGKLTTFEDAFFAGKTQEAVRAAVEDQRSVGLSADILDQVQQRETFIIRSIKDVKTEWKVFDNWTVNIPTFEGRTQKHLADCFIAEIESRAGGAKTVMLTPEAKNALEQLPAGVQPIFLKSITSMETKMVGSGRDTHREFTAPPSSFLLQESDIGYVQDGKVYGSDGQPVDVKSHEHGENIERQDRMQRSFGIGEYQSDCELRQGQKDRYPHRLFRLRMQSGATVDGVTIAQDALAIIDAPPPDGYTLVLNRKPRNLSLSTVYTDRDGTTAYRRVEDADLIQSSDLAYARIEGDSLMTRPVGSGPEQKESVQEIEKNRTERSRDLLRIMGNDPSMVYAKRTAATMEQGTATLRKIMDAKDAGSAREPFIEFAQTEGKAMLDLLNNPETLEHVEKAKEQLLALKRADLGVALGPIEQEIDRQVKALDGFIAMLRSPETRNLLEKITDKSNFAADTWFNFWTNEFPRIAAALIAAVAAAAVVTAACLATGGLAAIPFVIGVSSAAAGAAGGMIGSELAAEAIYYGHQLCDADVREGRATFTARSRLGKWGQAWMENEKVFNAETGQYEELTFLKDVVNPYAKEFAFSFATTYATIGLGSFGATQLSRLLQNTRIVERVAAKSDIMKIAARLLTRLNTNKEALARAGNFKQFIKQVVQKAGAELPDEASDELLENGLEKFLNNLSTGLAATQGVNGTVGWGNVAAVLLMIAKGTRIGKSTMPFAVKSKEDIPARAQAIKLDLEQNGAVVTDLGKGYMSVDYPVLGDDGKPTGKREKAQLMPEVEGEGEGEGVVGTHQHQQSDAPGRRSERPGGAMGFAQPERGSPLANTMERWKQEMPELLASDCFMDPEFAAVFARTVPDPAAQQLYIRNSLLYARNGKYDPRYVVVFRRTQPAASPAPEQHWTTDYITARRGLRQEISGEQRATSIILCDTLGHVLSDGGFDQTGQAQSDGEVKVLNNSGGFDQSTALFAFKPQGETLLRDAGVAGATTSIDTPPRPLADQSSLDEYEEWELPSKSWLSDPVRLQMPRSDSVEHFSDKLLAKINALPDSKVVVRRSEGRIRVSLIAEGKTIGNLSCELTHDSHLMRVVSVDATHGYGPVLYDIAMEVATVHGEVLGCDPDRTSDDAYGVWQFYHAKRPDVAQRELPLGYWFSGRRAQKALEKVTEDPSSYPDRSDPLWSLWNGYQKQPDLISALRGMGKMDYRELSRAESPHEQALLDSIDEAKNNPAVMKVKLQQHGSDIPHALRLVLAGSLLNRPISSEVQDAIQKAHELPGAIDEGNMAKNIPKLGTVYDAIRAELQQQGMPEAQAHEQAMREAKLLLDAGLAGAPQKNMIAPVLIEGKPYVVMQMGKDFVLIRLQNDPRATPRRISVTDYDRHVAAQTPSSLPSSVPQQTDTPTLSLHGRQMTEQEVKAALETGRITPEAVIEAVQAQTNIDHGRFYGNLTSLARHQQFETERANQAPVTVTPPRKAPPAPPSPPPHRTVATPSPAVQPASRPDPTKIPRITANVRPSSQPPVPSPVAPSGPVVAPFVVPSPRPNIPRINPAAVQRPAMAPTSSKAPSSAPVEVNAKNLQDTRARIREPFVRQFQASLQAAKAFADEIVQPLVQEKTQLEQKWVKTAKIRERIAHIDSLLKRLKSVCTLNFDDMDHGGADKYRVLMENIVQELRDEPAIDSEKISAWGNGFSGNILRFPRDEISQNLGAEPVVLNLFQRAQGQVENFYRVIEEAGVRAVGVRDDIFDALQATGTAQLRSSQQHPPNSN